MVLSVPATFRTQPRWWSDEAGRRWLDDLPRLVAERCHAWALVMDGPPWHGSNALVVPVRRADERLALRLAPPGDDVAAEVRALRFWAGRGTVRLIDADVDRAALLLERLDGDRSLAAVPLEEAVPTLARLMVGLAVPAPADVPDTRDLAASGARRFAAEWERCGRPTSPTLLRRAVEAAEELAAGAAGDRAVDGDLHHDQVLRGERASWLVVDPLLLRGDLEYDLARVLWTRLDEMRDDAEIHRHLDTVVDLTGVPPRRARNWVLCRSMDYLLWGLRHGLTTDPDRCRRLLSTVAGS